MMKQYAILWDYNGVIVNDEHLHEQAFNTVINKFGAAISHEQFVEYCVGRSDKNAAINIKTLNPEKLAAIEALEIVRQKKEEYERVANPKTIISPGAPEQLKLLAQEFRMAIISGSYRNEIIATLEANEITNLFETLVTIEDISRSKPDPEGYVKALDTLGLEAADAIVVEDTPAGIAAAKAAGVTCIGMAQTLPESYLTSADYIVKNITQISPDIIRSLVQKS